MIRYLLDTNIMIYAIRNRPRLLREKFNRLPDQMAISSVTWGELVYGVERSAQPDRNLADIESMAARLEVIPFDQSAANHCGRIRADLHRVGTPIGPYDMMIAGQARARGLVLVTNNLREFRRVTGLMLENWMARSPAGKPK